MRRGYIWASVDFLQMILFGTAIKHGNGKSLKDVKIEKIISHGSGSTTSLFIELSGNGLPEYCENAFKKLGLSWGTDIEFREVDQPMDFL